MSDTRTPGEPVRSASADLSEAAQQTSGGTPAEQARETAGLLRQEAAGAVQDIKAEGAAVAEAARDRAMGFAEEQKRLGAEQAEGLARAVHGAADQLQSNSPQIAHYVHEAASAVDGLARNLRESSPGQFMGQLEDLARRQPVAFFGAAVLAGFAMARFAKSSAEEARHGGAGASTTHGGPHARSAIGGGTVTPHSTAMGAPGWVQERPDQPARPATVAAASLGGAAARTQSQAGQTRPVNEAG
jgi:hypothetical protein